MNENSFKFSKQEARAKARVTAIGLLDGVGFFNFPIQDKILWRNVLSFYLNDIIVNNADNDFLGNNFEMGFYYLIKYFKYVVKIIDEEINFVQNLINVNNNEPNVNDEEGNDSQECSRSLF